MKLKTILSSLKKKGTYNMKLTSFMVDHWQRLLPKGVARAANRNAGNCAGQARGALKDGKNLTIAQIQQMGCNCGSKAIFRAKRKGLVEREEWFIGATGAKQKRYYGRKQNA